MGIDPCVIQPRSELGLKSCEKCSETICSEKFQSQCKEQTITTNLL